MLLEVFVVVTNFSNKRRSAPHSVVMETSCLLPAHTRFKYSVGAGFAIYPSWLEIMKAVSSVDNMREWCSSASCAPHEKYITLRLLPLPFLHLSLTEKTEHPQIFLSKLFFLTSFSRHKNIGENNLCQT